MGKYWQSVISLIVFMIDEHDAITLKEADPNCYRCADFTSGRYAWVLTDIVPITPIPTTRKLGI